MKVSKADYDEAKAKLLEWLKPGDTVYTIPRHVSRSGMTRDIGLVIFRPGGSLNLTWLASRLLGLPIGKRWYGLRVSGCGMNMASGLVRDLSLTLFGDGKALRYESL